MKRRIYIGLSGPTFFDYQHQAPKTANDGHSSPNPVLENALGLTVFYDEVWFLCESLCPQTLRGHDKVKYLDQQVNTQFAGQYEAVVASLSDPCETAGQAHGDVLSSNFEHYWKKVERAGVYWSDRPGRALDNHSHALKILGVSASANSNRFDELGKDLALCRTLQRHGNFDLCLNSFTRNLYNRLYPNQFDPLVAASDHAMCGGAVINAFVPNCMTVNGPDPDVFDKIANSRYAAQFRGYIQARQIEDAYACHIEVIEEINHAISDATRRAADAVHPTRGLTSILIDVVHDQLQTGLLAKLGRWVSGVAVPQPISAAAFVLDLKDGA